jgi:hypothetical protein
MNKPENISFFLNEIENQTLENQPLENSSIDDLMSQIEKIETPINKKGILNSCNNDMVPYFVDFQINFTVKQLLTICDFYGISKTYKLNKCNKEEIIHHIMVYENDPENTEIVIQRKNFWFYLNELKKDKFMKKFVLW